MAEPYFDLSKIKGTPRFQFKQKLLSETPVDWAILQKWLITKVIFAKNHNGKITQDEMRKYEIYAVTTENGKNVHHVSVSETETYRFIAENKP